MVGIRKAGYYIITTSACEAQQKLYKINSQHMLMIVIVKKIPNFVCSGSNGDSSCWGGSKDQLGEQRY
jgi:hypothetical protein